MFTYFYWLNNLNELFGCFSYGLQLQHKQTMYLVGGSGRSFTKRYTNAVHLHVKWAYFVAAARISARGLWRIFNAQRESARCLNAHALHAPSSSLSKLIIWIFLTLFICLKGNKPKHLTFSMNLGQFSTHIKKLTVKQHTYRNFAFKSCISFLNHLFKLNIQPFQTTKTFFDLQFWLLQVNKLTLYNRVHETSTRL